jgi:trans-aconitate methyltransferase
MKESPKPEVYGQELIYMPYKESLRSVADIICSQTPLNGSLVDLMCGPGYLLGQIAARRKDLSLRGVDLDERYVDYSKEKYPEISFEVGDVLLWEPKQLFDAVICTGALHHISYEKQAQAVERMDSMVKPDGFCIVSDSYIDDYSNENERKIAAAKLDYEYLRETIQNGAPKPVIEATIDILHNDVLMREFKTSLKKRLLIFQRVFGQVESLKTWPEFESEYGDYISICRKRKVA